MLNFLHNFEPSPVIFQIGPVALYWYGLIISLAILTCSLLFIKLAKKNQINENIALDLVFYLIIGGLVGARIWHVLFYNFNYFSQHPLEILFIWHGGMAIFGSITAGLIILWLFSRINKINFWLLADLTAVVMPLGQAIGRWGNYFNQELFGWPCSRWWCLPISPINRPDQFLANDYFQPLFLFEMILLLILFSVEIYLYGKQRPATGKLILVYLGGYAAIRLLMEFFRLDIVSRVGGLNWLQWLCLSLIIIIVGYSIRLKKFKN